MRSFPRPLRWLALALLIGGLVFVASQRRLSSGRHTPFRGADAAAAGAAQFGRSQTAAATSTFALPPVAGAGEATAAPTRPAAVVAFDAWFTALRRGTPTDPAVGTALARARRSALKELIATDPRAAFACAVPRSLRAELPAAVVAELETPVDAYAAYEVAIVCGAEASVTQRHVVLGERRYEAFVYGRRLDTLSKPRIPVHGFAIDERVAIAEEPYRGLEPDEARALGADETGRTVLVGDAARTFASSAELDSWRDGVLGAEALPGPATGVAVIPHAAISSWVAGEKRVLWVRAEFPDEVGLPVSDDAINATMATVNGFYHDVSRGQTSFTTTIFPATIVLPNPKSYYAADPNSYSQISDYVVKQARAYDAANGGTGAYNPDTADRWIVIFKRVPEYTFPSVDNGTPTLWGGRGMLGAKGLWLNGTYSASTVGHELGHNQGLSHSHAWSPTGTSSIKPGSHVEYGDPFDVMGNGPMPTGHFNVSQKAKLQYLEPAEIAAADKSGTYRISRSDDFGARGVQAVQIMAGTAYDYWLEFRQLASGGGSAYTQRLRNGILVHWGKRPSFTNGTGTYVLDMTPTSGGSMQDAPLMVGETFTDPDYALSVTPVAVGGTAPNEWIDVRVEFGASGSNHNPVLEFTPPSTLRARTDATFSATGTDPDGDTLYYKWDFGDGQIAPSSSAVTHQWLKGGSYTISCTALDGRGGVATKQATVKVEDPLLNWTQRSAVPDTTSLEGVTYGGGQFVAVGGRGVIAVSPDGVTWAQMAGVVAHDYRAVAYNGSRYVVVGGRYNWDDRVYNAAIDTSDDGALWSDRLPNSSLADLRGVSFGAGQWVAVGFGGLILTSQDGETWAQTTSGVTQDLYAVNYSVGTFVAVGAKGAVLTSTDGKTWTNRTVVSSATLRGVGFASGRWLATSGYEVWSSVDAVSWSKNATGLSNSINGFSVGAESGLWLAPSYSDRLYLSTDGVTWDYVTAAAGPVGGWYAAAEGNGSVVLVGSSGRVLQTGTPRQSAPTFAPSVRLTPSVSAGQALALPVNTFNLKSLQLVIGGVVAGESLSASPTFTWTPTRLGNTTVQLRGIDADGRKIVTTQTVKVGFNDWKWQSPRLGCGTLKTVAYAFGRWWAGGELGAFVSSGNGTTWAATKPPSETRFDYSGAASDGQRLVFVTRGYEYSSSTYYPTIWTTTNGSDWKGVSVAGVSSLSAVANGNGRWVAVGGSALLDSNDGVTWTKRTIALASGASLYAVAYGAGRWVTVGSNTVMTSTDPATWAGATVNGASAGDTYVGVAYLNGRWVAVGWGGKIITSPDGLTWAPATSNTQASLTAVGTWWDRFVAVGSGGTVLTSVDGTTWTKVDNPRQLQLHALATRDNRIVAVGQTAEIESGDAPAGLTAIDTSARITMYGLIAEGDHVTAATYGYDFAIGKWSGLAGRINDGGAWIPGDFTGLPLSTAYAVTRGPRGYVVVGSSGRIYGSTTGTAWTMRPTGTTSTLYAIAQGAGTYVAVGDSGLILSSPDADTWTPRASGVTGRLRGVVYGAAGFVAVGDGGAVANSKDGVTWTTRVSGTTAQLNAVTWSAEMGYVAVGSSGTIVGSADGAAWTPRTSSVTDWLTAVAATPFGLVAISSTTTDRMLVSGDGLTWTPCSVPAATLNALAADDQMLWAAGADGRLISHALASGPLIETPPASTTFSAGQGAAFSVTVRGTAPLTYQWQHDGVPVVGATQATLTLARPGAADVGSYTVTVTDGSGRQITTNPALLRPATVVPMARGRLANLSVRSTLASGQVLIVGFSTSDAKSVLVRGVGPTLGTFGVSGAYGDPRLDVCDPAGTVLESNDNWSPALSDTFTRLGAFPLSAGGKDAAVLRTVRGGASALLQGNGAGTVLVEVYDAGTGYEPRLMNVSARNRVGTGDAILIAGFVVDASAPVKLLIRGIGPTLAGFGVSGTLADPKLAVFDQDNRLVASNDNWSAPGSGTAALAAAFAATGAFRLDAGTKDAALLVSLPAGLYSAQLSGADGGTGEAMIEVYEVP